MLLLLRQNLGVAAYGGTSGGSGLLFLTHLLQGDYVAPPVTPPVVETYSGGYGSWDKIVRPRTRKEIEADRIKFGVTKEVTIILDEVIKQSKSKELLKQDLKNELKLKNIEYKTKYLYLLIKQYQLLIDDEISFRLRQKQDEDDLSIILMLM